MNGVTMVTIDPIAFPGWRGFFSGRHIDVATTHGFNLAGHGAAAARITA
jgi:hypothetical protein